MSKTTLSVREFLDAVEKWPEFQDVVDDAQTRSIVLTPSEIFAAIQDIKRDIAWNVIMLKRYESVLTLMLHELQTQAKLLDEEEQFSDDELKVIYAKFN